MSYISYEFSTMLSLPTNNVDSEVCIKLANGKLIPANQVIHGCTLNLNNHIFSIALLLVELGSFDVVIGMDGLSKNRAKVLCRDKIIRIPLLDSEPLII